jgi:hypothetical protein
VAAPVDDEHRLRRPSGPVEVLEAVAAYGPLACAVRNVARARWNVPAVFIDPVGPPHRRRRSQALQAELVKVILRKRHVRDLVVRFGHEHLKGSPHGRSRYA